MTGPVGYGADSLDADTDGSHEARMRAGERVGPYRVERSLGRGGMAETFVATRTFEGGSERPVCLKRMLPDLARDADARAEFLREAAVACSLRHGNVVLALDHGFHDGHAFLVLELIEGVDLRGLLRALRADGDDVPDGIVALVAAELACALDYAHALDPAGRAQGILHRDLSPANVLLGCEGEVKLADFGIAKIAAESHVTRSGLLRGKVPYMAPEYVQGGPCSPATDLFALGVTLFECCAGRRPFVGANEAETLRAIVQGERPALRDLCPARHPGLLEAIEALLASNPLGRPASGSAFAESLGTAAPRATARASLGSAVRSIYESNGRTEGRARGATRTQPKTPAAGRVDRDVRIAPPDARTRSRTITGPEA